MMTTRLPRRAEVISGMRAAVQATEDELGRALTDGFTDEALVILAMHVQRLVPPGAPGVPEVPDDLSTVFTDPPPRSKRGAVRRKEGQ